MKYPKISIVTPSFNQAEFIEETINSVLNQNYPNLEYVIIDGGSTDGSVEIIQRYAADLAYWVSEPDAGHANALNKGFAKTTGEVMGWINSDDLLHPGALKLLAEIFSQYKEIEWLMGQASFVDTSGRIVTVHPPPHWNRRRFINGDYRWIQQESTYWRRSLWHKAGACLSEAYQMACDFELWVRFFRHAQLYSTYGLIGAFRFQPNQRTRKTMHVYEQEIQEILRQEIGALDTMELSDPKWSENPPVLYYDMKRYRFQKKPSQISEANRAGQVEVRQQSQIKSANEVDSITAQLELIHQLQQKVAALSTTEAALAKLVGIFSAKIGFYHYLKRHENSLRRGYRLIHSYLNSSKTANFSPQPVPTVPLNSSPVTNSNQTSQRFEENITNQDLVKYIVSSGLRRVLCINPSPEAIQLLFAFFKASTDITCIASGERQAEFQAYGFSAANTDLAEWMIATHQMTLDIYDGLLLDARIDQRSLLLLKGRLGPGTKIFIHGKPADDDLIRSVWGVPQQIIEDVKVYETPPVSWLDPNGSKRGFYEQLDWPWKAQSTEVPSTLPSGKPWPKISIVTVTLNQGNYLEETLRSVLLQNYPNLEYIVLDGGSTDNTPVILERYRKELAYCISEPDKGQADALNKGFRLATGDILAWLNSDDRYLPGALFRVALAFDTYNSDMVSGGCALVQDEQRTPLRIHHNVLPVGEVTPLPLERLLDIDGAWLKGDFFFQPEVFWTRHIWERSGAYINTDLFYVMDYELWLRLAHAGAEIVHIPDTLTLFRLHENQKTGNKVLPFLPEIRQVNTTFQEIAKNRQVSP